MSGWNDLVGIEYREGGRTPAEGLDCYGVARLALERFGYQLPADYREAMLGAQAQARELPAGEAIRAGDVLEITGGEGFGLHLGVAIDGQRFIHATQLGGCRIDRIDLWQRAKKVQRVLRLEAAAAAGGAAT